MAEDRVSLFMKKPKVILRPKAAHIRIPDQHAKRRPYSGVQLPAGAEGHLKCPKVRKIYEVSS